MTAPACLRTCARIVAAPNGIAFLMNRRAGFGRYGSEGRVTISGKGIEARADSWQDARALWIKGALATAKQIEDDAPFAADLVERMGAAE